VLGQNPNQFGETLLPTANIIEFYAANLKRTNNASGTTGALTGVGIASTLAVTGAIRFHAFSAQLIIGAAAATNVAVTISLRRPATVSSEVVVASQFFAALNAAATVGVGVVLGNPWVLVTDGWQIVARATGTAAGTDHVIRPNSIIDNITGTGE